jgi:hypothetical protein
MGASLMQRRCVGEEGLRVVNSCQGLGKPSGEIRRLTKAPEEAMANSVPAAAVIRRWQALFGITGRKGHVGGRVSRVWKRPAQPDRAIRYCSTRAR